MVYARGRNMRKKAELIDLDYIAEPEDEKILTHVVASIVKSDNPGEKISIVNLHPESKKIEFNLPVFNFTTAYLFEDETQKPEPLIDTLILEPEENLFTMVWRSKTDPEKYNELQQINIYETEE